MARKRRAVETVNPSVTDNKATPRYADPFQQRVGKTIESAGSKLDGQGRNILYGLGALLVLGIIVGWFLMWNGRSNAVAQTDLGKAIETSQAQITDTPTAGSTRKTFKTENERAEAAIAEFQQVAEKHGGDVRQKARYFAAVNRISLDRNAAAAELESLAASNDEVGKLSKYALANIRLDDGKLDEALTMFQDLVKMDDPLVAKDTINFAIANIYEKQNNKQGAADVLFNLVKSASEAKDLEGKPVTLSGTAQSAKEKLRKMDPVRAAQIPEPESDMPVGAPVEAPGGM